MQTRAIIISFIVFVMAIFLTGCKTTDTSKIIPEPGMKYFIQIKEGETAVIKWDFKNAHRVKIEGYAGSFLPKGEIKVHPEYSSEYKLTAYRGFKDSLDWTVYIEVLAKIDNKPKKRGKVKTGEPILVKQFEQPSYTESEYISGIIDNDISTGPEELRIVRTKYHPDTKKAELYVLLMDKLGNFIAGYGKKKDSVMWSANNVCGKVSANYSKLQFNELSRKKDGTNVDFAVLIDNSGFAENKDIKEPLKNFIKGMEIKDKVMVSVFNQSYLNIFKLMEPQSAILDFDDLFVIGKQSGFNACNSAMLNAIRGLNSGKNPHRALVLITYSNDNASFKNTVNDVVKSAILNNVEIFVIGIGDIIEASPYRYLCSATGGKFYILLNDEIEKFKDVLGEILFAYRNSYKVEVPLQTFEHNCNVSKTKLLFSDNKVNLSAAAIYPPDFREQGEKVILAAGFDTLSSAIDPIYYNNLSGIAAHLKKSPNTKYRITGYSFGEGDKDVAEKFALLRAEAVRDYLVSKGVSADNLIVDGVSELLPMFTFPYNTWLKRLNRRVEVKKYEQSLPEDYELIAAFAPSEVESQKIIQKWEERGYKAYYERTITNNGIAYKIKLWGFKSKKEAKNTIKKIKSKYKEYLIIDN